MSLFRFTWLRRLIRNNTTPIPVDRATWWKNRLAVAYMLVAWNAFGLVGYMIYKGKGDWAKYYGLKSEEEQKMSPATSWKNRLAVAYMLVAWNAFGLVGYMIYKGKGDWAKYYGLKSEEEQKMSPGQQWAKTLGIKDPVIYRVSGLNVSRYEAHDDGEDLNKQTNNIST